MTAVILAACLIVAFPVAAWRYAKTRPWHEPLACQYQPTHHNGWHEPECYARHGTVCTIRAAAGFAALYGLTCPVIAADFVLAHILLRVTGLRPEEILYRRDRTNLRRENCNQGGNSD